jgi:hypothetical protein
MVNSNKGKVFFQINNGSLNFAFQGEAKDLKKKVEEDMKGSVKQLTDANKDIKSRLKKLPKDGSLTTRHLETQNKLKMESNSKEIIRLKAMTLKDFEFFTLPVVDLDA